ncbi:MAG: phosphate acyltransferase PlsX [Oscillospiraceae bacterium]|nr:phosphate acyltransferase PlsX [Oscillospiraceae bacterium]
MKIIVDAMGGDNAPDEIIKGAMDAVSEISTEIILCGIGEEILRVFERMGHSDIPRGIEIVNASEVITMEDDPSTAIRTKKDSSMTVGLTLLRDGMGDAFVSAGSTGALLSGATLIVKRIRGIRRAALVPFLPNSGRGFYLIDCGANAECTPEYLLQFAFMGSYYAESSMGIEAPRVGLLNNGAEATKGTQLQLDAYALIDKASRDGYLNFIGNVEAKEAVMGACDVLVCDGFTGNVFLKSLEGMASLLMSELKGIYGSSLLTKLSALMIKKRIMELRARMNPDTIGGTIMLGISKPVIKAHGSSKAAAIKGAIRQAAAAVEADPAPRLQANIEHMKIDSAE